MKKDANRDRFSVRQQNVENLLSEGKHSVTEITIKLGYADPRSYIRYLRLKGVNVQDEWVQNNNVRYKMYWVAPKSEIAGEITQSHLINLFGRGYHD
mgnify:FL=1|jgi:hypothetical protein